jgi:hypothetical protein
MVICGGTGAARTPTYDHPLLAVDLFSVESTDGKVKYSSRVLIAVSSLDVIILR